MFDDTVHIVYIKETDGKMLLFSGPVEKVTEFLERNKMHWTEYAIFSGQVLKTFEQKEIYW